ncbi:MFS transporter [Actinomadura litoris]|uniref:MFS transporter n=1 Tax=Actinomadura litoris TaxID=2678616 RepID=UPI001FA6AD63|nr:MFS transporter [Actinomadura litoris]
MTTVLEPDAPTPARSLLGGGNRAVTIGIVTLVTLLAFEAMAVSTVMPAVARGLDGLSLYAWGFSATLITSLLSTVVAGGWVDRSGPARPFLVGIAAFVVGLAIAGTAPAMWVFVAGRAVQGLGTGIPMVALYVLIARAYPEELRSRVFAALSAAWVLPSLVGPAIGGAVADHVGWRWVFLALVPLVVPPTLMLIPVLRGLPAPTEDATAPLRSRLVAAVAITAGAAVLLYGLDGAGWTIVPLAAVGIAGLGFGLPRLLPPGALRMRRGLPSVILARGLLAGAFFGADVYIPLTLTSLHDFTPTMAGVVLTVGGLGWSAASQIQGRSERSREFFVLLGAVLVTAGIVSVTVALQVSGWAAVPAWMIGGAGMGFANGSLSVLTLDRSAESEQGHNSSALQISDTLGASLVVGVAGALVTGFGEDRLGTGLAVAGTLFAAIAVLGVVAALRLEAVK